MSAIKRVNCTPLWIGDPKVSSMTNFLTFNWRSTSRNYDENQQQTQPTYDTKSGNRTKATLKADECSQFFTAQSLLPIFKGSIHFCSLKLVTIQMKATCYICELGSAQTDKLLQKKQRSRPVAQETYSTASSCLQLSNCRFIDARNRQRLHLTLCLISVTH